MTGAISLVHNADGVCPSLASPVDSSFVVSPYFFCISDSVPLAFVLSKPYSTFVELGSGGDCEVFDNVLKNMHADNPDISISLSTVSCYNFYPAGDIAQMISHRFHLSHEKLTSIQTCLQEVIMNSIFHGNLSLNRKFHSFDGFSAYQGELENRIADDKLKYKRIGIRIWNLGLQIKVSVSDEGKGFSMPENKNVDISIPYGRGLMFVSSLARKVWIGEDRKTVYMLFKS